MNDTGSTYAGAAADHPYRTLVYCAHVLGCLRACVRYGRYLAETIS